MYRLANIWTNYIYHQIIQICTSHGLSVKPTPYVSYSYITITIYRVCVCVCEFILYENAKRVYFILLGSFVRVGYRIPVPDFYLVLHGLRYRKSTIMD